MLHFAVAAASVAATCALLWWFVTPIVRSLLDPPALSYRHTFTDTRTKQESAFPSIYDPPSVHLTVVVPAYNEGDRLGKMLDETLQFLNKQQKEDSGRTFEIIVVDDGSRDSTSDLALEYSRKHGSDRVRLLKLACNQGKGGAVQQGMLHGRGEYLLMADADAATDIRDARKLEDRLHEVEVDGRGIAVGSRAHLEDEAVAKRKWYRNVLMYGFHFLVWFFCVKGVRDTQCGFKLFARKTASQLFGNQRLRRWCFDVELLHVAERLGIPIVEVSVHWNEVPGSKLRLIESSIMMARDLVIIRLAYMLGIWSILSLEDMTRKRK